MSVDCYYPENDGFNYTKLKREIEAVNKEKQRDSFSKKQVLALNKRLKKELIEKEGKCFKCSRTKMLTIDHVIPKTLLADFGIDIEKEFFPEDLVVLCRPCNTLKSNHLDFSIPQTKELLLKFLQKI